MERVIWIHTRRTADETQTLERGRGQAAGCEGDAARSFEADFTQRGAQNARLDDLGRPDGEPITEGEGRWSRCTVGEDGHRLVRVDQKARVQCGPAVAGVGGHVDLSGLKSQRPPDADARAAGSFPLRLESDVAARDQRDPGKAYVHARGGACRRTATEVHAGSDIDQ